MVGPVISRAFEAFGALFPLLAVWTAVLAVPYEAVLLALQLAAADTDDARNGLTVVDAVASALLLIPLVTVLTIRVAEARRKSEPPAPRRALGEGFELLPAIALTQLLVLLAIAAIPGAVVLLGLAIGFSGLVLAGLLALIGSAVINGVRLCLAIPIVILEDVRYGAALRRSIALVRGSWGRTALVLLAMLGIALLFQIACLLLIGIFGGSSDTGQVIAQRAAALAATVVTTPFIALCTLELYRLRRDATPATV